ncbi:uncharacterized protein E0L32_001454 [Thyridium curvatum]|uniref:C2H2-type domain-containing protein n=1 Tax=Thyridium curvatum TaxID=1093900 RepID=A0A507AS13_9PEZI|nr:uncharacterized protein E0L32_001454 [Thyridium curvatum]TPX10257.1 hypothetical protein E0L32_001454 [Thyridium curvatum]
MATISSSRAAPADSGKVDSHPYTCNTCQVAFRNSELQKGHMRQDWHRYNLKRRVASLPPISSDVFNEKVLQAKAATSAQADKARYEKLCNICQRTYYSENSYQNHLSGQKHRAKEAAAQRKPDTSHHDDASSVVSSTFSLGEPQRNGFSEVDADAEEEFSQVIEGMKKANLNNTSPLKRPANPHPSSEEMDIEERALNASEQSGSTPTPSKASVPAPSIKACLFCNYQSPTVLLNAAHMERFHGMFIPEKQYLVDLDGLIGALQERVREEFECLYCGKYKGDVFAIQTHMRDKGHCKIPYTTEAEQLEIGEFYDFRSTYSDSSEDEDEDESMDEDERNGGAKLGMKRPTTIFGEDGDELMAEDDGWETDSSASSLDSDDLTAVPAGTSYHQYERLNKHPHHSKTDPRSHHQKDGWHSHAHKHAHTAFYDEFELHLPSGRSVGHRAFNRYFRQNLRDYPTDQERAQRQQLAIENGEDPAANSQRQIAGRNFGRDHRAVVPAGENRITAGVTDRVGKAMTKQEQKRVRRANSAWEKRTVNFAKPSIAFKYYKYTEGR